MACSITIQNVSFLTGAMPQRIRVYGRAPGCLQVQLTTSNPTVTSPVSTMTDALGHFMLEAILMQAFVCDAPNPPTVTVSCIQKSNPSDVCMDAQWLGQSIPCCEGTISQVTGLVPQGTLLPAGIGVQGTCFGCASNMVTISANKPQPGGGSVALINAAIVPVDPVTGQFTGTFGLISAIACGDPIEVVAACTSGSCTIAPYRSKALDCPQCMRADLLIDIAPCAQPNDPTTQVTITANVGLPTGTVENFELDFGNGASPCTFTLGSPTAGPGAVFTHTCPAVTYNTGQQFTATLRIPGSECPHVSKTFLVDCTGCPNATASVAVGGCVSPGPGVDPKLVGTCPVTFSVNVPAGVPANLTTTVSFNYGGPDQRTANPAAMPPYQGNTHTPAPLPFVQGSGVISETVNLRPGTYYPTASLYFTQGNLLFCPPSPALDLTSRPAGQPVGVDVPTCIDCPPNGLRVSKQQNPPTAPHWKFTADVDWGMNPPPMPPSPATYDWTITAPNMIDKAIAHTDVMTMGAAANTIMTEDGNGWTGPLATPNNGVQLAQGGQYSVAVNANFAHDSGLPLNPATQEVGCNTTGGDHFDIAGGTLPNCQILGGVNQNIPAGMSACADPTQGIVATVDFTVSGTNLGSGPFQWDFGDPASGAANNATSSTLTARHVYSTPGNFPVSVKILAAGSCSETDWDTGVTIPLCPCPSGQIRLMNGTCGSPPGSSGEGLGCLILRWVAVALVALGIIGALILACKWASLSQLQQGILMGIGIGFFVVGIILFAIWVVVCRVKPCLWGLLLAGQVCLAVALVSSYMTYCCLAIFLTSAIVFGALAVGLFAWWIYRCMPSVCQVLIELTPVVSDVIAMIAVVAAVPFLRNCLNPFVGVVVGWASAILVMVLVGACTTTPTKTGGPAR
jgi:hypothetical protein